MNLNEKKKRSPAELLNMANELGIENASSMRRQELLFTILKTKLENTEELIQAEGVIEIMSDGFGFLRSSQSNYLPEADDIYVSPKLIRTNSLRTGDLVYGTVRIPNIHERYLGLDTIELINNQTPQIAKTRVPFENLTPIYPQDRLIMEDKKARKNEKTAKTKRAIDLISPIGKGQRSLIVAPPRTGKTMMLQTIANSVAINHPEAHLMVLLIDERPEEVTDMQRSVTGEVIASTFDEPASRHVKVAEMVIEKAKRLVEHKKDVVILLDSITRLARAYNTVVPSSGKVLTGGVDAHALQRPKRFFGAARNIEEGGSLTIISTALIDTGSRMDEVIFEEFKGTGNSEIVLERKVANKRIYPAIDIKASGTRKDDLLISKEDLNRIWILRRMLNPMTAVESMEFLLEKLDQTQDNEEFFNIMNK